MLPNSFAFLGLFAGLVVVHFALPRAWRWPVLLIASLWVYSTFDPRYVLLLLYCTLAAWGAGLLVHRHRGWLWLGIGAQLAVLVLFKYVDFVLQIGDSLFAPLRAAQEAVALPRLGWILPAGLSFYVFSCISYLVDISRGKLPAERHLGYLALYVSFFPKLIAGPIERAPDLLPQLKAGGTFVPTHVVFGLQLLLLGLVKKVVIADNLTGFVDAGFSMPAFQSAVTVLIAVYFYAFQIYCDFSGYSDIAIGLAAILGFVFKPNFRRPYLSRNIGEFWSARWHISLSRWFTDYVYIPLGGSRSGAWARYRNVMIVFLLSGLWHGAAVTFLIWGALNGGFQVLWQLCKAPIGAVAGRLPAPVFAGLSMLLTFHLVLLTWVFFRAPDLATAMAVLKRIFGALPDLPTQIANYSFTPAFWQSVILIAGLMVFEGLQERGGRLADLAHWPKPARWALAYAGLGLLVLFGNWGASSFVYMQF